MIRDNGVGIPDAIARFPAKGLGLVIINALSQQIEVTASFHRDNGARFELSGLLDPPQSGIAGGASSGPGGTAAAE